MAKYTGNKGKCEVGGVTYKTTSWSLDDSIEVIDTTEQDTTAPVARSYISNGLIDTDGSITFDVTNAVAPALPTTGAAVAFELQDSHYKYTGNCLIVSSSTPREVGAKVVNSFTIKVTGGVTRGSADI